MTFAYIAYSLFVFLSFSLPSSAVPASPSQEGNVRTCDPHIDEKVSFQECTELRLE